MGDITSNLELYWNLNETSGSSAADSSGNGHTGTTVNSPTWGAGQVGNALTFAAASSQYCATANLSVLNGASAFTIAAWLKKTANGNFIGLGQGSGSILSPYIFLQCYSNGVTYFAIASTVATETSGSFTFESTAYHHFACVFDGSQSGNSGRMKIYLDGVSQTLSFVGTIPATSPSPTLSFEIGRTNYDGSTFEYNSGSMDEVRVYSRALAAADVIDLVNFTGINNGNLSSTLGALTLSATGTELIQGSLSATLGALTLVGDGNQLILGNLSSSLGALTLLGEGVLDPPLQGSLSVTLGGLSLLAAGTNPAPPIPPAPTTLGTGFAGNYTPPGIDDCRPRFGDSDNVLLRKILKLLRGDCNGA